MTDSSENVQMPDFEEMANIFVELSSCNPPSELHGALCGYFCGGARLGHEAWLRVAAEHMEVSELTEKAKGLLCALYDGTLNRLSGGEMDLRILLPDDETELSSRAEAVGQWTQGFLGGFGLIAPSLGGLSEDTVAILKDYAEIAKITAEDEQSEEGEQEIMEICEYVRMACITLFEELSALKEAEKNKPSVH